MVRLVLLPGILVQIFSVVRMNRRSPENRKALLLLLCLFAPLAELALVDARSIPIQRFYFHLLLPIFYAIIGIFLYRVLHLISLISSRCLKGPLCIILTVYICILARPPVRNNNNINFISFQSHNYLETLAFYEEVAADILQELYNLNEDEILLTIYAGNPSTPRQESTCYNFYIKDLNSPVNTDQLACLIKIQDPNINTHCLTYSDSPTKQVFSLWSLNIYELYTLFDKLPIIKIYKDHWKSASSSLDYSEQIFVLLHFPSFSAYRTWLEKIYKFCDEKEWP